MKRTFNIFLLMITCMFGIQAQQVNRLYLQDVSAIKGKSVTLPVYMENTSSKIVAMQFDVGVPYSVLSNMMAPAVMAESRSADHVVRVDWCPDNYDSYDYSYYRVMVFSPTNTPIKANDGQVLSLGLPLSEFLEEEVDYRLILANVVLGDSLGNNLTTDFSGSVLRILPTPDFEVSDVSVNSSTIQPGDKVDVSWKVTNVGNTASTGGWSESVYFVSRTGEDVCVGTFNCDNNSLAPDAVENRTKQITIPQYLGIDGNVNLRVDLTPNSDSGESYGYRDNNTASTSGYGISVGKKLYLILPEGVIGEGTNDQISCSIGRSGNWKNDLVVTLTKTGDDRLNVPETVTISNGSSKVNFYLTVNDNDLIDTESIFTISASAAGYETVTGDVEVENNDHESLTVTAPKTNLNEGESMTLTVGCATAPTTDLAVNITSDQPSLLNYPSTVTIAAGTTSASFNVTAVNDNNVTGVVTVAVKASATGKQDGECLFFLTDDDMPELELQLLPSTVSEGAGVSAVVGKVIRKNKTENKVTIVLSDDSEGQLYYSSNQLVMNAGVSQAEFTLGVIDNGTVDGNRNYTVTAAVYISSCDCSAGGNTTGSVTQTLTVTDDDGPSLKVASLSATFNEGSDNILTISHNTTADHDVTITLSSDYDDGLEYDHTVTIPAGQNSADVTVHVKQNDVSGDSRTIAFNVIADGYTQGTCWVQITDQTLPDATISDLTISKSQLEAGETATVSVTVKNMGSSELPSQTRVNLYFGNRSNLFARFYTQEPLVAGSEVTLTKDLEMPLETGDFRMQAIVNEDYKYGETVYSNNASEFVSVTLKPAFEASAQVNKSIYAQGETVTISGKATGSKSANANVEVYILNDGLRQTVSTMTDTNGNYSAEYAPFEGQAGHFVVGACFPGEKLTTEMAAFDIYAVKILTRSAIQEKITVNETTTKTFVIKNPGILTLSGLTVEASDLDADCSVTFEAPSTLEGDAEATIKVMMTGVSASVGDVYKKFNVHITTTEGAEASFPVYYYSLPQSGRITASELSINTTMIKDQSRDYPVTITNTGRGETGKITVSLPEAAKWLSLASPKEMASMQSGDSATVIFRFTPTEDLQLNVPVTAQIAINCTNGEGMPLPMTVEPVSTAKGTLVIDVCDENTYYAAGGPHLEGATVTVKHPTTGAVIAEGVSDANGLYSVELPEGYYAVVVTAAKHDQYTNNLLVNPGRETVTTVNLSIQGITITWNVEETEVEDKYEIVTTVTYETNVPIPVVELAIPSRIPVEELRVGESLMFNAILTNKGLVTAHQTQLDLPEGFNTLKFEAMKTGEFTIAPHEVVVIPVKVTRIANGPSRTRGTREGHIDNDPCVGTVGTLYAWDCGNDRKWHRYGKPIHLGSCGHSDINAIAGVGGGGLGIGGLGFGGGGLWGGGGGYYGTNSGGGNVSRTAVEDCEPCQNRFLTDFLKCYVPGIEELDDLWNCLNSLSDCIRNWDKSNLKASLWSLNEALGGDCNVPYCSGLSQLKNVLDKNKRIQNGSDEKWTMHDALPKYFKEDGSLDGWALFDDVMDELKDNVAKDPISRFVVCGLKSSLKPCDLEGTPANASRGMERIGTRQASVKEYPSFISDYQNTVAYLIFDALSGLSVYETFFGSYSWAESSQVERAAFLRKTRELINDQGMIDYSNIAQLLNCKPENVNNDEVELFIERWNNTVSGVNSDNFIFIDAIHTDLSIHEEVITRAEQMGYVSENDMYVGELDKLFDKLNETGNSVCASITLQFKQEMVLTRQAFRGTLTVFNGHDDTPMTDVKLRLAVTDEDGNVATSHEFQINPESLEGFTGELSFDDGWTLLAQETGTATILFVPTRYAAETTPKVYSFGGALSYIDPFTGLEVTREISPVNLTVKPSPVLDLSFFMQRNILGDDALTADIIEPTIPAEFSLIIKNKGYGDATNVKMVTEQPEIIDNEKGLLINFELLSSQLNGGDKTLALGQSVPTEFGTIPAGGTTYAQWWFTSSLLGHFTSYKTDVTHLTSYDNPDLSLLDEVSIHELIHTLSLSTSQQTPLKGFLVNDVVDSNDMPDMLYLTDGTTEQVASATAVATDQGDNKYTLQVTASAAGWNYGSIVDPTAGRKTLLSITRQSDGAIIPIDNFWQTDRTLRDGKEPLYEFRLHFADNMASTGETYTLLFVDKPMTTLDVSQFEGVVVVDGIVESPVTEVRVTFNKEIASSTFTTDDLTLTLAGNHLDVSKITITEISKTQFSLDLQELTIGNGYYELTVQTAGITDADGITGEYGRRIGWTQYKEDVANVKITANDYTITYGDDLPQFDYTVDGGDLSGVPQLSCDATASSSVGTYPIVVAKGTITNEDVTYVNGVLTIVPKVVGLSWSNTTLDYDGNLKLPTATATGLVGDDVCEVTVIGNGVAVGTYTATASALDNANYLLPAEGLTCSYEIVRRIKDLFRDGYFWATYVAKENLALPAGLDAYVITSLGTTTATASPLVYIPEDVPVLLKRNDLTINEFSVSVGMGTRPTTNLLKVYDTDRTVANREGYVLFRDEFVLVSPGTLPAGRVFLPINESGRSDASFSRSIIIEGDGTTGISGGIIDNSTEQWYDIQSRKFEKKPTRKGVYILNGRKVVVK